jgi:4-hydroxybenzoate polyprenyltransferase
MNVKALCTVGRVSNLPTVWTNILAAAILAGASFDEPRLMLWAGTLLALSLMYLGGMFLNDGFDVEWDKQNNNPRPIVTGDISLKTVMTVGTVLMTLCSAVKLMP